MQYFMERNIYQYQRQVYGTFKPRCNTHFRQKTWGILTQIIVSDSFDVSVECIFMTLTCKTFSLVNIY